MRPHGRIFTADLFLTILGENDHHQILCAIIEGIEVEFLGQRRTVVIKKLYPKRMSRSNGTVCQLGKFKAGCSVCRGAPAQNLAGDDLTIKTAAQLEGLKEQWFIVRVHHCPTNSHPVACQIGVLGRAGHIGENRRGRHGSWADHQRTTFWSINRCQSDGWSDQCRDGCPCGGFGTGWGGLRGQSGSPGRGLEDNGRRGCGGLDGSGKWGWMEDGGEQVGVLIDGQEQVCQAASTQYHNYCQYIPDDRFPFDFRFRFQFKIVHRSISRDFH